jgi:hypothetical protein
MADSHFWRTVDKSRLIQNRAKLKSRRRKKFCRFWLKCLRLEKVNQGEGAHGITEEIAGNPLSPSRGGSGWGWAKSGTNYPIPLLTSPLKGEEL